MDISDFRKQETKPEESPFWISEKKVISSLGPFTTILEVIDDSDLDPPDQAMVDYANRGIAFFLSNEAKVIEIVAGAYREIANSNPRELITSGVPERLPTEAIGNYLIARRLIFARQKSNLDEPFQFRISLIPLWDQEHGLNLKVVGNKIVDINGYSFRFSGGRLLLE